MQLLPHVAGQGSRRTRPPVDMLGTPDGSALQPPSVRHTRRHRLVLSLPPPRRQIVLVLKLILSPVFSSLIDATAHELQRERHSPADWVPDSHCFLTTLLNGCPCHWSRAHTGGPRCTARPAMKTQRNLCAVYHCSRADREGGTERPTTVLRHTHTISLLSICFSALSRTRAGVEASMERRTNTCSCPLSVRHP